MSLSFCGKLPLTMRARCECYRYSFLVPLGIVTVM